MVTKLYQTKLHATKYSPNLLPKTSVAIIGFLAVNKDNPTSFGVCAKPNPDQALC